MLSKPPETDTTMYVHTLYILKKVAVTRYFAALLASGEIEVIGSAGIEFD